MAIFPNPLKKSSQSEEEKLREELQALESQEDRSKASARKPSTLDKLAGEAEQFVGDLNPYLPQELIGGSVPYVPGTDNEAVWNAASQACGTERVHYCYTVEEGRCWYLACPSKMLASSPDSWCPLASALPGNSEYWDKETVYLYEQEGQASALRWDPETGRMQVFLGASRTILPRIQSLDANFVTINPDIAAQVPWKNRALMTEKLSRAVSKLLLYAGLFLVLALIGYISIQYILLASISGNLEQMRKDTTEASSQLLYDSLRLKKNDLTKHYVRIDEILKQVEEQQGTLVRYEVNEGKVEWTVLAPPAFRDQYQGRVSPELESDGRVRITGSQ